MGRYGSGSNTTDDFVRLDVRRCNRQGYLQPGHAGTLQWSLRGEQVAAVRYESERGQLTLRYRTRIGAGEWQEMQYPVKVEWMPCHFGGQRAWFRCPACCRRVAILYLARTFVCRHCLRLAYESQREAPHDRALRKAQGIHEMLGGTGVTLDLVFKPKGMHWRTFYRQKQRLYEAESRSIPPWLFKHMN